MDTLPYMRGTASRWSAIVLLIGLLLAILGTEALSWYDTRYCDCPYPWRLTKQQLDFRLTPHSFLARHVLWLARSGWMLTAALALMASSRAGRGRAARLICALVAIAAPVLVLLVVNDGLQDRDPPFNNPFYRLQLGYPSYAAGCLFFAIAAHLLVMRSNKPGSLSSSGNPS